MKQRDNSMVRSSNQSVFIVIILLAVASLIIFYVTNMQRSSVQNQTEIAPDSAMTPSPVVPNGQEAQDDQVFCTLDAKVCPDGSYVGRVAPNCEFAPCPDGEETMNTDDEQNDAIDSQITY